MKRIWFHSYNVLHATRQKSHEIRDIKTMTQCFDTNEQKIDLYKT